MPIKLIHRKLMNCILPIIAGMTFFASSSHANFTCEALFLASENNFVETSLSDARRAIPKGNITFYDDLYDLSISDRVLEYQPFLANRSINAEGKQNLEIGSYIIESNLNKSTSKNPYIAVRIHPEDKIIHIDMIKIDDPFKGLRISQFLLASILTRHPETQYIHAHLDHDNAQILDDNADLPIAIALKMTPFYKTMLKLGFTNIVYLREFYTSKRSAEVVFIR